MTFTKALSVSLAVDLETLRGQPSYKSAYLHRKCAKEWFAGWYARLLDRMGEEE
jgi:hypothetical protein